MNKYELRPFQDEIEVRDNEEVVAITDGKRRGWYAALVALPADEELHTCNYPIDEEKGHYCSREVESEDEYCWQHSDND